MKKCILSAIAGALAMLIAIMVAAAIHANKEQPPENMSTSTISLRSHKMSAMSAAMLKPSPDPSTGVRTMWAS